MPTELRKREAPGALAYTFPGCPVSLLSPPCCMCVFSALLPQMTPHKARQTATNPWCPLPKSGPDSFWRVLISSFQQRPPSLLIKQHNRWGTEKEWGGFVLLFPRSFLKEKLLFWPCRLGAAHTATPRCYHSTPEGRVQHLAIRCTTCSEVFTEAEAASSLRTVAVRGLPQEVQLLIFKHINSGWLTRASKTGW